MKKSDINIRDPFVFVYGGKYYMYGSRVSEQRGFDVYVSEDLEEWSDAKSVFEANDGFAGEMDFWAPEVHEYKGKIYMFASFRAEGVCRWSQILVSDTPDGEFRVHSNKITPDEWDCLDGTFYVEGGVPYMIFCHEWTQIKNGEVCAVRLKDDLSAADGKPFKLWAAGDASWSKSVISDGGEHYVTDGPFLFVGDDGKLKSLWSSYAKTGYVLAVAESDNGSINGNWIVSDELIFEKDGGHGMIFKSLDGKRFVSIHSPNTRLEERPVFIEAERI